MPRSDVDGEQAWPTQPLPVKPPPFARQLLTEADLTDISPDAAASVLERLRDDAHRGQFMPPSEQGTIIYPGFDGGAEWGGVGVRPETGRSRQRQRDGVDPPPGRTVQTRHGEPGAARRAPIRSTAASCHGVETARAIPQRTIRR